MIAMPDPTTFAVLPWRPEEAAAWGACSATSSPPSARPTRATRATSCAAPSADEAMGFDPFNVGPELEYFLFRDSGHRGPRRGRLLRPDDARRRLRPAARDRPRAGEARHPRRVHPPRGRPVPARDRHALRRRAEDRRRLHDLPHHGQGVRAQVRLPRDVHAQAAVRRERLGHAHAPVAVRGRAQRLLRRRRPVLPVRRRQGLHRRPARHAREICSIFAQWVNSYKRLVPGFEAPVYCSWWRRNRSALVRVPLYTRARRRRRGWSYAARTRPATRT